MLGVSRPITQTEHQAMRASFEKTFGGIDEVVEPSADYLSTKMEEVENGEIIASPLSDVTSKRKAKTLGIQTSVDAGGHVRIVKQRSKGSLPQNTEELRAILRVEGKAWVFLGSKYRNKVFFKDMTQTDQVALRPPWTMMISYEFELRKEAVKRAFRDSRPLSETLREVQGDAQLKEQFFTSPSALQSRSMRTWFERPNYGQPWKWRKGEKGPGKGKGGHAKGQGSKGKERQGQRRAGKPRSRWTPHLLCIFDIRMSR